MIINKDNKLILTTKIHFKINKNKMIMINLLKIVDIGIKNKEIKISKKNISNYSKLLIKNFKS